MGPACRRPGDRREREQCGHERLDDERPVEHRQRLGLVHDGLRFDDRRHERVRLDDHAGLRLVHDGLRFDDRRYERRFADRIPDGERLRLHERVRLDDHAGLRLHDRRERVVDHAGLRHLRRHERLRRGHAVGQPAVSARAARQE
ncbi:MAG TPA: hypothetical protein VIM86_04380, partial [Thermodesulfobacteriota bacterium]